MSAGLDVWVKQSVFSFAGDCAASVKRTRELLEGWLEHRVLYVFIFSFSRPPWY